MGKYKIYRHRESDGKLESTFCEDVNEKKDILLLAKVGGTGRLHLTSEGNICFSFFYPYLIQKYNQKGGLVAQISRRVSFYKLPTLEGNGKIKDVLTGSHELAVFQNGMILHVIKKVDFINSTYEVNFDLFDKEGNWLISFTPEAFNSDWRGKVLSIDAEGYLYLDFWDPFPHVRKFKLMLPEDN